MRMRAVICGCLLLTASGCPVLSLQPLYDSAEELVYKPELIGRWTGENAEDEYIEFASDGDTMYTMTVHQKDGPIQFSVGMVEARGQLFLDLLVEEPEGNTAMWLHPLHEFWAIQLDKDTLIVKSLSGDWAKERSEKGRLWVRHERIDDKTILTAKPDRLKRFVRKWVNNPDVFVEVFTLHRVPSEPVSTHEAP